VDAIFWKFVLLYFYTKVFSRRDRKGQINGNSYHYNIHPGSILFFTEESWKGRVGFSGES